MKCVECGSPISRLSEEPVKGNITLTICSSCNRISDKFIEYEEVLIFLNLILCKTQVYRHILFNVEFCNTTFEILKLFLISCFLDSILLPFDNFESWILEFAQSILKNLVYISAVILGGILSGLDFSKLGLIRAILVASFGKLGAFMIVTWKYSNFHRVTMSFFIYLNNMISVRECLETNNFKAFVLIFIGILVSSIDEMIFEAKLL